MIKLWTENDTPLKARQTLAPPSIYLDHWAIRKISDTDELCARFVDAVRERNGTVAISWLNLVEFSRAFESSHAVVAGDMVQRLYPNLFFIQVDPFIVIDKENELIKQPSSDPPHADNKLLKETLLLNHGEQYLFNAVQLFQVSQESNISEKYNSLVSTILRKASELNKTIINGSDKSLNLKKTHPSRAYKVGTRFILREIMRQIFLDRNTQMNNNDAIDLVHTVVPSAYCDYVLLDKRWRTLVERLRQSFASNKVNFTIAKPFSENGNGLSRLVKELQDGNI